MVEISCKFDELAAMPPGRPWKKVRNRNKDDVNTLAESTHARSPKRQCVSEQLDLTIAFDSTRIDWQHADAGDIEESESEEQLDWEDINNEEFGERLAKMVLKEEIQDGDWIPSPLRTGGNLSSNTTRGDILSYCTAANTGQTDNYLLLG